VEALVKWRGHDAAGVHRRILDAVRTFQDGLPPDDDLTVILLKRSAVELETAGVAAAAEGVAARSGSNGDPGAGARVGVPSRGGATA
jgi:hypothetical protein